MYKLKSVAIEGLWNYNPITIELNDDVNIFIGENGTGKTTFINIINAVLTVDPTGLESLPFTSVQMNLAYKNRKRKISVIKVSNTKQYVVIRYQIGTSVYEFPLFSKDIEYRQRRTTPKIADEIGTCRGVMQRLCSSTSLNVHRETFISEEPEVHYSARRQTEKPPIDKKIEELLKKITEYQLQLEYTANEFSKKYQYEVLSAILYNKQFDSFSVETTKAIDVEQLKEGLIHAYRDLGVIDDAMSLLIDNHTTKISNTLKSIEKTVAEKKSTFIINDVLPISLLKRTEHIIRLSKELEESKNKLFSQMNLYSKKLNDLFKTKRIEFEMWRKQRVSVVTDKNIDLSVEQLSSGEKQLFVLLTETLLQRGMGFIFIADEPELSLHISWQVQLIGIIQELNPNAQLIIATHSPEVAAQWKSKIFRMEDYVNA